MSMRIAPRASTIVLLWRGNSQPSRTDCAESENAPLMPETGIVPLGIGPTRTCASNSRRVKCSVAAIASVRDILSSKDDMGTKYHVREGALNRKKWLQKLVGQVRFSRWV